MAAVVGGMAKVVCGSVHDVVLVDRGPVVAGAPAIAAAAAGIVAANVAAVAGGGNVEAGGHDRNVGRSVVVGAAAIHGGRGGRVAARVAVCAVVRLIVGGAGIEKEGQGQEGQQRGDAVAQDCFHASFDRFVGKTIHGIRIRAFPVAPDSPFSDGFGHHDQAMNDAAVMVTGGAGYIGSHTLKHLAFQGRQLVVLDNFVYGHHDAILDEAITVVEGDIGDPAVVEEIFSTHDIGAVVHFAAFINVGESVQDPLKYYRNNTARPLVLLEAMQRHGCKVFVLSSTAAVYGEPETVPLMEDHQLQPVNPYGWSKLMLEQILRDCGTAWGLRSACLRYFNASGSAGDGMIGEDHEPETHLIPRILLTLTGEADTMTVFGTDWDTPDGTCVRDYIHVNDLADAHAKALDYLAAGGESIALNLGTGVGMSVKEIIDAAEAVTGKTVPVEYGERRAGDPAQLVADPGLAKEILGWEAQHRNVREIVESAWTWMNGPCKGHFEK